MLAFSNDYYGMIFRATQSVELFCAYFTIEFSRVDRNIMSLNDTINDITNGTITEMESKVLDLIRKDGSITIAQLVDLCGRSQRTITRALFSLKSKQLIERIGSNKSGIWKVK